MTGIMHSWNWKPRSRGRRAVSQKRVTKHLLTLHTNIITRY